MKKPYLFIVMVFLYGMTISIGYCEEKENASEERSLLVLPVITYTTDTGFGAGIAVMKTYNPSRLRVSNIQLSILLTQKKQATMHFGLDHYFHGNVDRVNLRCEYTKFPTYFYGMGTNTSNTNPEKYTPEYFNSEFFYERRFKKHFRIKTQLFFSNQSLAKSEPNGLIQSPNVPWSTGRLDTGSGISLLWDTRDNLFATRYGSLVQVEYMGSLYQDKGRAFNSLSVDLRHFFNPFTSVVSGSMFWLQDCRGDVPFYQLSKLGSYDRLRGYEYERFRGRSLILFQQDFRYTIWGPIGGALFVATGRVADDVKGLFSGRYHTGVGAGLRYYYNREDNLVIRADFARGSDSRGIYFTFGEAF